MSIKSKAVQGAKWTTISTIVNATFQFAQVAIVARILQPSSFGIVSISTLVINFLSIFAHFGFSNSIIYKQETDRRALSTIYLLNILIGLSMFLIINLSLPLIISYYHEPKLGEVLRASAFYFPIVFLGQIYNILLEKELRFKTIALIEISASFVSIATTIILAYKGFDAMALIYGLLCGQGIRMICQNVAGRKLFTPALYFNIKSIKDHLTFGTFNVADSLLGFANSNVDSILIGGLLGIKSLGYYTIASQIAVYPIVRICPIIMQISYPIIAKIKDNMEGLRKAYLMMTNFIFFINVPLLAGLFIMAAEVIPLVYGPKWAGAVPLTKILVIMGGFSCLTYPLSPIAYSKGKPNLLFYLNVATFLVKLPLIYFLAVRFGITGVAYGFLVTTVIAVILNFVLVDYLIGPVVKQLLVDLIKPVVFAACMIGSILLYRKVVGDGTNVHTGMQILLGGAVFTILTLKYKISLKEIFAWQKNKEVPIVPDNK